MRPRKYTDDQSDVSLNEIEEEKRPGIVAPGPENNQELEKYKLAMMLPKRSSNKIYDPTFENDKINNSLSSIERDIRRFNINVSNSLSEEILQRPSRQKNS